MEVRKLLLFGQGIAPLLSTQDRTVSVPWYVQTLNTKLEKKHKRKDEKSQGVSLLTQLTAGWNQS